MLCSCSGRNSPGVSRTFPSLHTGLLDFSGEPAMPVQNLKVIEGQVPAGRGGDLVLR